MVDDIVRKNGYLALGSRMRRIGERLQADVQSVIDEYDLPVLAHQFPLLYALDDYGPLEIGQLARALGVSQPGVTRSVGQLANEDCVRISVSDHDRRVRRVELTAKGRDIMQVGRGQIAPRILAAFDQIFPDHAAELLPLLDQLEDALNRATLAEIAETPRKEQDHG